MNRGEKSVCPRDAATGTRPSVPVPPHVCGCAYIYMYIYFVDSGTRSARDPPPRSSATETTTRGGVESGRASARVFSLLLGVSRRVRVSRVSRVGLPQRGKVYRHAVFSLSQSFRTTPRRASADADGARMDGGERGGGSMMATRGGCLSRSLSLLAVVSLSLVLPSFVRMPHAHRRVRICVVRAAYSGETSNDRSYAVYIRHAVVATRARPPIAREACE